MFFRGKGLSQKGEGHQIGNIKLWTAGVRKVGDKGRRQLQNNLKDKPVTKIPGASRGGRNQASGPLELFPKSFRLVFTAKKSKVRTAR